MFVDALFRTLNKKISSLAEAVTASGIEGVDISAPPTHRSSANVSVASSKP